jgi:hypothetical protein
MPDRQLNRDDQRRLLQVAAQSVAAAAANEPAVHEQLDAAHYPPALRERWATFVTLRRHGELRGCRGTVVAEEPLIVNVARSARSAARADERFAPVSMHELDSINLHVAILHPPQPMDFESEADLLARLRPGRDGVILSLGSRQGLFLPAVWCMLPEPATFLDRLKQKAGLPPGFWSVDLRAARFTVEEMHGEVVALLARAEITAPATR